jgi:hypothetical protein
MKPIQLATCFTAGLLGLQAPMTSAQRGEQDMPMGHGQMHGMCGMGMMSKMDANGDQAISRDEFMQAHEKMFEKMDEDGDGSISQNEMTQRRGGMMDGCMMGGGMMKDR